MNCRFMKYPQMHQIWCNSVTCAGRCWWWPAAWAHRDKSDTKTENLLHPPWSIKIILPLEVWFVSMGGVKYKPRPLHGCSASACWRSTGTWLQNGNFPSIAEWTRVHSEWSARGSTGWWTGVHGLSTLQGPHWSRFKHERIGQDWIGKVLYYTTHAMISDCQHIHP